MQLFFYGASNDDDDDLVTKHSGPPANTKSCTWITAFIFDIRHSYYIQLTAVLSRDPLTSIARVVMKLIADQVLVFD